MVVSFCVLHAGLTHVVDGPRLLAHLALAGTDHYKINGRACRNLSLAGLVEQSSE